MKHKSNEKPKARKHDHSWASAEIFPGVQGQHVVYHFQIADDQCSLQDNFTLSKYLLMSMIILGLGKWSCQLTKNFVNYMINIHDL